MRNAECGMRNEDKKARFELVVRAMSDFVEDLKLRTRQFGLRIIRLVQSLEGDRVGRTIGNQLLRSGTSVGANYRAACRARSQAEFRAKLGIVEEEADESIYWMELLIEAEIVPQQKLDGLLSEANELLSIIVSSINTSKKEVDASLLLHSAFRTPHSALS
jgi:four helix bundle protein